VFSLLLTLDGILGFSWFRTGFLGLFWAYIIRFFAVAYQPLQASMDNVSTRFGDAAASLGKNTKQTLWHIHLPLMRSQLMGVFVLVFVDLVKELPMTLLLRPTRFDTLASKIFEYAEDEMLARTAAPALILIFFGVFALWFNRKKYDV
jgi:iron(III) transport system permease protein